MKRTILPTLFSLQLLLSSTGCDNKAPPADNSERKPETEDSLFDETEADETEADETEADETEADETEADETEAPEQAPDDEAGEDPDSGSPDNPSDPDVPDVPDVPDEETTSPEDLDADDDGFSISQGDCDDRDDRIHPDAQEICDEIDNDCDALVDIADPDIHGARTYFADADADGFGDASTGALSCEAPEQSAEVAGDCDDANAAIHPSAEETCDGVDNDCDTQIDDADPDLTVSRVFYRDADSDGYGATDDLVSQCEAPTGFVATGGDCDDDTASIHPSATEICDGFDNDCDTQIDDADSDRVGGTTYYRDADADGYGSTDDLVSQCEAPTGFVATGGDCDDDTASIHPSATETCDGFDNDCDSQTDDADSDRVGGTTYYRDADADGYGSASISTQQCERPAGYTAIPGDCDDSISAIHPSATEICDGFDNDCDTQIDDADSDRVGGTTYYRDADADGIGDAEHSVVTCEAPSESARTAGDCDDGDSSITVPMQWYRDIDGDGYGQTADVVTACFPPGAYVDRPGDCDDSRSSSYPGAAEVCDDLDNDCDGLTDDADSDRTGGTTWYRDLDADGLGDASTTQLSCEMNTGFADNAEDCDDSDSSTGAAQTWYTDGDGDGYGAGSAIRNCFPEGPLVHRNGDCNDDDVDIHPSAIEYCGDDTDSDCDSDPDDTCVELSVLDVYEMAQCTGAPRPLNIRGEYMDISYNATGLWNDPGAEQGFQIGDASGTYKEVTFPGIPIQTLVMEYATLDSDGNFVHHTLGGGVGTADSGDWEVTCADSINIGDVVGVIHEYVFEHGVITKTELMEWDRRSLRVWFEVTNTSGEMIYYPRLAHAFDPDHDGYFTNMEHRSGGRWVGASGTTSDWTVGYGVCNKTNSGVGVVDEVSMMDLATEADHLLCDGEGDGFDYPLTWFQGAWNIEATQTWEAGTIVTVGTSVTEAAHVYEADGPHLCDVDWVEESPVSYGTCEASDLIIIIEPPEFEVPEVPPFDVGDLTVPPPPEPGPFPIPGRG